MNEIKVSKMYNGWQFFVKNALGQTYYIANYKSATKKIEFDPHYKYSLSEVEYIINFIHKIKKEEVK